MDHKRENERKQKDRQIMNLLKELKRLRKMKVMVIPIIVGALGTVKKTSKKRLAELEIRGRIKTIQTTALLGSARILRRVRET